MVTRPLPPDPSAPARARALRPGRLLTVLAVLAMLLGLTATPAQAITGGQPDGDGHPNVALLLAPGLTFCSGVLISDQTILTAGHCTEGWDELAADPEYNLDHILVSFDPQAKVDANWEPVDPSAWYVASEWLTYPTYDSDAWPYTMDYGLLFLDKAVTGIEPAALPELGMLDPILTANGATSQLFQDVGYGIQGAVVGNGPPRRAITWERKVAVQQYLPGQQNNKVVPDYWFNLKNIPSSNWGGGCGGDSGSPIFWGDTNTVVAVHTGGYRMGYNGVLCGRKSSLNHRIDIPEVLDWITDHMR